MSRGGRPQLAPENRRQERAIYLSERELNSIKLRAVAAGLTVPEFMREALSSGTIVAASTVAIDQWSKLAPLASNINQISTRLNSEPGNHVSDADLKSFVELGQILSEIRLRLLGIEPSR